jgi:hypothetical protein
VIGAWAAIGVTAGVGRRQAGGPSLPKAGLSVKRFIPSEFGFHQLYRAPGEPGARLHPVGAPLLPR